MKYLSNAFSLQMVQVDNYNLSVTSITEQELAEIKPSLTSIIGHQDLANILGVETNRVSVTLKQGDILYVAQLIGGRLPEGATTLPDGFKLKYLKVEIKG